MIILIIDVSFDIIYVKHGLDVINLQIKLYSKLDPRRLKEPVRDFSGIQKLLESTGEPVVIEAFSKQIFDKTLVIRRDVTFIGNFVCQLFLTGDASVTILNGNISSPNEDVYPIILDRNYVGQLSIINSKITLSSKANLNISTLVSKLNLSTVLCGGFAFGRKTILSSPISSKQSSAICKCPL